MKIIRSVNESMSFEEILTHVKHIVEYKNDPRFASVANSTINAIKNFGALYNQVADNLAKARAGAPSSNDSVVGFVNKENFYVKYDRTTEDYVFYNPMSPKLKTKTLHKKTEAEFQDNVKRDYASDLPQEKSTDV